LATCSHGLHHSSLCQRGYIIVIVCLYVCLFVCPSATLSKKLARNFQGVATRVRVSEWSPHLSSVAYYYIQTAFFDSIPARHLYHKNDIRLSTATASRPEQRLTVAVHLLSFTHTSGTPCLQVLECLPALTFFVVMVMSRLVISSRSPKSQSP